MNTKQLKYVIVLANEGSFGKAADFLNISQPSLSQYIKNIENQIGTELFNRSGGNVRLTDAGRIYIEVGKKILDLEHQMEGQIMDTLDYKVGSITIGTAPYRSASMMPTIIKRFRNNNPGISVVVEERVTSELIEGMEHGEFDCCLTTLPINERLFDYETVMEEEMVLAVPKSYPLFDCQEIANRKYPAISVSQLNNKGFVTVTETQVMQKTLSDICLDYNLHIVTNAVVKSLDALIGMVKAEIGMALVPTGIEKFCTDDEVRFYSFKEELPRRKVAIIWRKDIQINKVTKEFIKTVKEISW